jgi:glycosyltransferase involved in cell wall biosynthesis
MISNSDRPRLLFSYLSPTSFVRDDRALLEKHYDVRTFHFDAEKITSATGLARLWMRQLQWLLRELPEADLLYGWFADHHAVLPVLLGRWLGVPTAIVLGGMDCNRLPEVGYGVWASRWRAPLVRWMCRHAAILLPVSEALMYHENAYADPPRTLENGIRAHVPNLKTPCRAIPTGYDPADWPLGPMGRDPIVSTVALIDRERRVRVKGIDVLIEVARRCSSMTFRIVGVTNDMAAHLRRAYAPPDNVVLKPPRDRSALVEVYHETSVYAQLSRTEGLPNVVAEAMCCGCVPFGSRVGGTPELVEGVGRIVERPDPDAIAEQLRALLDEITPKRRRAARRHITENYSREHRRDRLISTLAALHS